MSITRTPTGTGTGTNTKSRAPEGPQWMIDPAGGLREPDGAYALTVHVTGDRGDPQFELMWASDCAMQRVLDLLNRPHARVLTGAELVLRERQRQIAKGLDVAHDDGHKDPAVFWNAARAFLTGREDVWPFAPDAFHPRGAIWNLIRAGAMYLAGEQWLERRGEAPSTEVLRHSVEAKLDRLLFEARTCWDIDTPE